MSFSLISEPVLLRAFGCTADAATAHDLWRGVIARLNPAAAATPAEQAALRTYVAHGTLARRITTALGSSPTPETITLLYRQLADGLVANRSFKAGKAMGV